MIENWPIYKKELLSKGNIESNIGICTLWTEKKHILEHINKKNYSIAGQCYSKSQGISLIIRHCLLNKKIRYIILCGADLNNTGDALISLKNKGINNKRQIIDFPDSYIDTQIPIDSINKFRKKIEIIDKRNFPLKQLNNFLETLEKKPSYGAPEIFPLNKIKKQDISSSEKTGFTIREKTVGDAWIKILNLILKFGYIKKSQYSDDQKEIINLTTIISEEDPDHIDWKPYFQFTKQHFEKYLPQLMDSKIEENISYTYGSRLRNFEGINQIQAIIKKLKQEEYSRRAIAVTWDVHKDCYNKHNPCLTLIQVIIQDKLYLTAYIRSNDMFGAWPENALALRKVQKEIALKLKKELGDLIIISNSAHIYSPDWNLAEKIVKENLKQDLKLDPRGNILIETINNQIKITHLDNSGKTINEFSSKTALEAYKNIIKHQMISKIDHALDIGVELGKAETALNLKLKYIQDKQIKC